MIGVAQRGFAASFQRSAFSDQLPICDKFAGWASWMSFSEPEVPEVQRLSALQKLPRKLLVLREGPDLTVRFFARHKGRCELSAVKAASLLAPLRGAGGC